MLLQHLNDHCLEHIFEFLNLDQQFAMRNVCQRFANIIESLWRLKLKQIDCNDEYFRYIFVNTDAFREFMTAVGETVEKLSLSKSEQLNCLAAPGRPLPRVKSLMATFMTYDIRLSELFPALEHLSLNCIVAPEWKDCILGTSTFKSLDTLTELCLNEDILLLNIDLMHLPRLRKIGVHFDSRIRRLILRMMAYSEFSHRVHTLSYNFVSYFYTTAIEIGEFKNLQRLNFLGSVMYQDNLDKLERILIQLPHLREIHYRNITNNGWIPSKKALAQHKFWHDSRYFKFISLIVRVVKKQPERHIPLELNCYGPHRLLDYFSNKITLPPMLRLFLIPCVDYKNFPISNDVSIQCEWD